MITFDEIQQMSDEEKAALNKKLMRRLAAKIALSIAIPVAVHVAVRIIEKKLGS
jgi:hypothetical protein